MSRWYAHVPKTPAANRQFRRDLIVEANGSPTAQQWLKDCCRDDLLFYLNTFVWTFDPRLTGDKMVPFITFPIQDYALREIEKSIDIGRDLVIEKSRDLGATWMFLAVCEHRWHFLRDQTFMCLSRNAEAVDGKKNEDALFAKIDRIHKMLPVWLMPRGWDKRKHRNSMAYLNPENGCTINGGATVGDAAVGGRRTAIFIDEFSRIEEGYEIDLGTADVTNCRIFNFTAYGKNNAAYELLKNKYKKKIRLHWSHDPRKNAKLYKWNPELQRYKYFRLNNDLLQLEECEPHQYDSTDNDRKNFDEDSGYPDGRPFEPVPDGLLRSPVYDAEDTRRGNRKYMAINWDIDYEGSDDHFFDLKMLLEYEREVAREPLWEGDFEVDSVTGEFSGFVEQENGPLRLWFPPTNNAIPTSPKGYASGNDVSWGQGATPSCCAIADAATGEKVLEYVTALVPPDRFAARVVALCKIFRSQGGSSTLLAWERLGPGNVFGKTVVELNYGNVYYHGAEADKGFGNGRAGSTKKAGWPPNKANSAELLGDYQAALRTRRYLNRSSKALQEAETFVENERGIQSARGSSSSRSRLKVGIGDEQSGSRESHGDRVIMDALTFLALKELGGGQIQSQAPKEKPAADVPGTLEWRRKLHRLKDRERFEAWG